MENFLNAILQLVYDYFNIWDNGFGLADQCWETLISNNQGRCKLTFNCLKMLVSDLEKNSAVIKCKAGQKLPGTFIRELKYDCPSEYI